MFNSVQYNRMLDDEMKYTFGIKNLPAHLPQTAYGYFSAVVFMQSYIENHSAFRVVLDKYLSTSLGMTLFIMGDLSALTV